MSTTLIVEDEERIASFIVKGLRAAGSTLTVIASGHEAIQSGLMSDFDLIILDLRLPDIDGFDVLEELRGQGIMAPIIMLTARSPVADRVAGLEDDADDYAAKPFSYEELLARIHLRLRDSASVSQSSTAATTLSYGNLTLDYQMRQITVGGRVTDLSTREFTFAEMFLCDPRQVLSHEQSFSAVRGMGFNPGSNVVDVYMSYLCSKLGKKCFEAVRGMSYRLF